jgi:hypothetical protein
MHIWKDYGTAVRGGINHRQDLERQLDSARLRPFRCLTRRFHQHPPAMQLESAPQHASQIRTGSLSDPLLFIIAQTSDDRFDD